MKKGTRSTPEKSFSDSFGQLKKYTWGNWSRTAIKIIILKHFTKNNRSCRLKDKAAKQDLSANKNS